MDTSHSITFLAAIQYPISLNSNSDNLMIDYSPPSPTHDNWFDADSKVIISVPYIIESSGTRQVLTSWSIDKSTKRIAQSDESDAFATEIRMSGPYNIEFISKTQHYVNVISEYGSSTGTGWYEEGATAGISARPPAEGLLITHAFAGWDGSIIESEGYSASIIVDSPKTLTARWTADYSRLVALVIMIAVSAGAAMIIFRRRSRTKLLPPITNSATTYETLQRESTVSVPSIVAVTSQEQKELQQNNAAVIEQSNIGYQSQIMEYVLQKSIEKLETFHTSGIISDAKFSRIKGKLEQTFD